MRPIPRAPGLFVFQIVNGSGANVNPESVARALRRAVMARVQAEIGKEVLPAYFCGHKCDGSPASSEDEPHLSFLFDPISSRLIVVAPHVADHRSPTRWEQDHIESLERALSSLCELRAGRVGVLRLEHVIADVSTDCVLGSSAVWESVTPYVVTRHGKRSTAREVLSSDVVTECERRGLPRPDVHVNEWHGIPGKGLCGNLRVEFKHQVVGPYVLDEPGISEVDCSGPVRVEEELANIHAGLSSPPCSLTCAVIRR